MLQGSKSILVADWLGIGVGVEIGLSVGVGVGSGFGAADLITTPLFQTSLPFFFMQVKDLFADVAFVLSFLHGAPAVIF